jgi:hypothetical protein
MNINGATRKGHPIAFGVLVLAAIIEMCIAAWITAKYNANHNFPNSDLQARVRYILFASIWTVVLGSMYLVLFIFMTGHKIASVGSHFVFLLLTWIFWLAAAAALTQALGGALNCRIQDTFVYCAHLNALGGFAWLIWIVLTFMLLFVVIRGIMGARRGDEVTAPMVEV